MRGPGFDPTGGTELCLIEQGSITSRVLVNTLAAVALSQHDKKLLTGMLNLSANKQTKILVIGRVTCYFISV